MSALSENGGHRNIVGVLRDGWMENSSNLYFIDMELCDINLDDYLDYLRGARPSLLYIETIKTKAPVYVDKDSTWQMRTHNIFVIGSHIALGLEFTHGLKYEVGGENRKPTNETLQRRQLMAGGIKLRNDIPTNGRFHGHLELKIVAIGLAPSGDELCGCLKY